VDKLDMEVKAGQLVGLLGPNGAGKSTTINMITTMLKPDDGDARIEGYSITEQPFEVRKRLGIIFQDHSLDQRLTGRENMEFHCMLYKVPKEVRKERIRELTAMVELEGHLDKRVKIYSGGMKRRLEIARGLLHRPKLLILDEPTVGLDPQTRAGIWSYIEELRKQYGMAVLMTTHYMEEAEGCHMIYIMDQGKQIAQGSPIELIQSLGKNRIEIQTEDNQQALEYVKSWGITDVEDSKKGIVFSSPYPLDVLQQKLLQLPLKLISYNTTAFSLEDVFIKLTGKQIRLEDADRRDQLRMTLKRRR
jgi:ABC-2 type transport system ATP-binding protein